MCQQFKITDCLPLRPPSLLSFEFLVIDSGTVHGRITRGWVCVETEQEERHGALRGGKQTSGAVKE